ncbi:hypothetical protein [Ramlibacter rhizophilus]|uniref:Uncharacterized protein n=1 Tax=Ramlibacter rhizophilus TaxID=1781167 RepID=A0A4Z0BGK6_9BURK|nr:hypothetical protein [Ramlibacter rhizophilus]TFY97519.1 hypothetical protein EZ242_18555 [Ramlibacter rhizophilus]
MYAQEDLRRYAEEAERIANERAGLDDRLLDLIGSDAEKLARIRERERAAIDSTNQALLEQIYRQEDLRTAAQLAADQARSMQDAERSLQERLYGIFEGAITSVSEEIRRLTGQRTASQDIGTLQAQFAINTAQARALDPNALERLPDLSRAIEQASLGTARSRDEVDRVQARLAQSLAETLTVVSNQIGQPTGADDIVAELKASRDLYERGVEENQVHAQALIKAINKFTGIVGRWDIDGMPDVREIA